MITMYNWSGHARPPGRGSTKVGADRSVLLCCGPATGDAGRKLKCCKTEMLCWHLQWSLQSPHRPAAADAAGQLYVLITAQEAEETTDYM